MNYLTSNEIAVELEKKLKELKIKNINDYLLKFKTQDAVHQIDEYMQEYEKEETIDNQVYLKYHAWFEFDDRTFEHNVYYLKTDLYDDSVEAYINAQKLFSIN